MTYVCLDKGLFLSRHVEKTQEISSLEYFTFVRLDCEKLRRSLGDVSRKLSNTLLKNVVDTYRQPVPHFVHYVPARLLPMIKQLF
jgi:hypothetical protein